MKACLLVKKVNSNIVLTKWLIYIYMFLGESVPVSKLPITDASLSMMDLTAVNVRPEVAKHFLFCGTKIVRVRKSKSNNDGIEEGALAMVVRTGRYNKSIIDHLLYI